MSWGEIALGPGEPQVRMRTNTAEMFRGYRVGVLIFLPGRGNFKLGPGQGFRGRGRRPLGLEVGETKRAEMRTPTIQVCLLQGLTYLPGAQLDPHVA